jgi:hypothetical protein
MCGNLIELWAKPEEVTMLRYFFKNKSKRLKIMNKKKLEEGEKSLKKILLMMNYDTSNTLSENKVKTHKLHRILEEDNKDYKSLDSFIIDLPNLLKLPEEKFVERSKNILKKNGFEIKEAKPGVDAIYIYSVGNNIGKTFDLIKYGTYEVIKGIQNDIIKFINDNKGKTIDTKKYETLSEFVSDLPNLVKLTVSEFIDTSKEILSKNGFTIRKHLTISNSLQLIYRQSPSQLFRLKRDENSNINSVKGITNFIKNKNPEALTQVVSQTDVKNPDSLTQVVSQTDVKNKVKSPEKSEGIYRTKGDPYQYKVINGVWHTKGKTISNWTSLENNKDASKKLDTRFPNARKQKSDTLPIINPPQLAVTQPETGSEESYASIDDF